MPHNADYDDVYFSRGGGLAKTRHVFLDGNDLHQRFAEAHGCTEVLEIGFGTGLNFLATWQLFMVQAPEDARLHFLAVEKHPPNTAQLRELHRVHPELSAEADVLVEAWPDLIPGFHRRSFAGGRITLTLLFGDVSDLLPEVVGGFDALYLDGFAPDHNPETRSDAVFAELGRLARPGATVATDSSARIVRDGLVAAGFTIEYRPGFDHKRYMLVGEYANAEAAARPDCPQHVVVIGAGMAGAATAFALAQRGVSVSVFERAERPATGGSGNPAGIVSPVMSRDWNALSQLTGPAVGQVRAAVSERRKAGFVVPAAFDGVIRLARQQRHADRQALIAETLQAPAEFARWLSPEALAEATDLSTPPQSGWLFPGGGWLSPRALIEAWLADPRIACHWQAKVARLEQQNEGRWAGYSLSGQKMFEADAVVVATAELAEQLVPGVQGLIEPCRGQISLVVADSGVNDGSKAHRPITREGYLLGPLDGQWLFGASFKPGDTTLDERVDEHVENRARLAAIDPEFAAGLPPEGEWSGRVSLRATTSDRLPLVGPAPVKDDAVPEATCPGLYVNIGHGARGLTWGALLGEHLVAEICAESRPLPGSLIARIDPTRFRRRVARKAG